jgi:hypothetical protein
MSLAVLYKIHAKIECVVHSSHRMCGTLKPKKVRMERRLMTLNDLSISNLFASLASLVNKW